MTQTKQKWVVWSYDPDQEQTFEDVVLAASEGEAKQRVERARPYATLDAFIAPTPLEDHIHGLQRELDSPEDGFLMIEQEGRG